MAKKLQQVVETNEIDREIKVDNSKDVYYEVYLVNKPGKELIEKISLFDVYGISKKMLSKRKITYYDTPNDTLKLADVLLSSDVEGEDGVLTLEKKLPETENSKYVKLFDTYKISTKMKSESCPQEHIPFLSYSLARLFNEPLDFDPDYIFRKVEAKYEISIDNETYRIYNVNGFKCNITLEYTTFKNMKNERLNYATFLRIRETEDSVSHDLEDFINRVEKYCKFILRIDETKYDECVRLTRDLEKTSKK